MVGSLTLPGVNAQGFLVHRRALKLSILAAMLKPDARLSNETSSLI